MANVLQMKRGLESSLPTLNTGEFGFCTDSYKLFIGSSAGNKEVTMAGVGTSLPAHALVGDKHTASGLTVGWVLKATGATTFAWAQLQHTDLGGVSANQHHSQLHASAHVVGGGDALSVGVPVNIGTANTEGSATNFARRDHVHNHPSGLGVNLHHNQTHVLSGGDHTASGLTVGWVIRASGATTFAWAQLQHADLGGVSTGQHRETRPFKVSKVEYQSVLAGAWHTICDFSSVGEMEYIWLAIAPSSTPSDPNCAWKYGLKITADGVLRVDTQLGNFFCSTFGSPKWTTNHVGCTYMSIANGASSHYRYVSIPFSSSLKVEVRNVSNVSCMLWAQVGWHDGTKSYPLGNKIFRTTTKLAQSVTQYASYTLVDVSPGVRGRLQGFMLAVDGNANWTFLEGNIEIWIDGTKTIEYPGTEDAFLGAFYFGQVKFQTDRAGMTKQHTRTDDTNVYQGTMYRFYLEGEEIPFNSSLKIVWYNGESGHGEPGNIVEGVYSEVWYYTES